MLPEKLLHPRGSLWRRGLTAALIAATLLRCAVSPGTVSIYFGWAGGVAPTNLPKVLYLYGYIVAPGSSVHVATSGPDLYSSGATLNFGNVPNGSGLILTIELLDSNGAAANVIAYGQSAPFSLEPGKNVVVNVALELHTVTSVPSSGGIAVNGLANGEIGTPLVSLELYADPSAVGAQISNLPALPAGDGTMTLKTLTPDPTVTPPSGFKAYRYTGWDLEAGLPSACTTLCQRSVYVFFTDAEGIQSATSSTTVTLNRQKPTLSTHVTPQPVAGLGATIAIVATPSEPLGVSDAGIADITPHVYALADTTQEDELPNFLGAPLPNTEFTYEHPVTAVDLNGSYYAVFALQDIAGNTNVVGLDQSIQFAIDTTAPVIQHLVVSRGGAPDAGADAGSVTLFSQVAGYDQIHVTFDSTKPLVTCTAGIGGAQTACTPEPAAGANSYSWDYSVTAKDAEGNHPFSLVAFDDANNEAQVPNVTVTLDFTPPGLIPTPPSALHVGIGQTEILTLTPSKTLSSAPLLKVSGPGMLAFSAPAPSTGGSGYTSSYQVQAGDPSGAFTTTVTMTDLVGNTTAPPLAGPVFNVDTLAPLVSNVQTDAATYSEVAGHDVVALTFDVPKSVGSGLVVTLGGRPMACNPWAATSPSYSCTYQVNNAISDGGAADTAGPKTIQITATDEANNTASGSATVTFDFTTPTLTPAVSPNPATATTTVSSLSVTASKVLSSAAVVSINAMGTVTGTVTPGATALEGSGEEWSTSLSGAGASGQFLVTVSGEDPVGHVATASLPFTIDTIVPVISGLSVTPNAGGNGQTFSEVSPYNVVTVTFNTPKASTITAQVGGAAMSCGQFSVGQPSYTCNYTVLGSEGSGTKIVAVTAADEVQNTSQASASVVFDFTSPALTPTVQPNPANASASPVLSVSSTKPLATAAVSPITPVGSATGTVTAATLNGSATLWSAALSGAGADGTFTIPVQGTDALGHAATASVSFVIDAITPVITNVATNAQTFSEVIPFNIVTVTFDTPKAAGIAAAIGGNAMSCGVYQQSSPRYSCSYTISTSGAEGSGTKTIALTAHDEVGNASQQSVSVVFDFAAPVLTPTAAPNPANASAAPELTIASTKPLATASIASIDGEAGAIGQVTSGSVTGSGTAWSAVLSGTGADGTFAIKVEGTDEVGHSATASTTFVVDGIVPTITNLQANAQTYSEVSPYNTVTVTFDTPKAATIGATVGGSVMSCATQSSTQTLTVYSCTYGISPHGQEGSGTKIVSVVALDEVDNTSQASTSVVFDFAALTLSPIVVPNPANASSAPVLTMATSKPLSAGPLVTVTPQAGATGNVSASTPSGSGTSWTSSIAGPGATGSFLLAMQAIDAVGHVATASTVFSIEAVPPVLAAVTTNATTYSEVNGFNQITLTFTSTEVLDTAPAQLTVQVGGKRMNCGTAQGTAPPYSYSCTDTVSLSDTAGTQAITIEAVDSAGNEATAGSSVTFDFTAPVLTPTVAPNPSNSTSSPVLTVAVSKALQNQPGIAISPTGSLTTGGVSGGGTSWSYPIRATGTVTGAFTITATGTDAVGHQASGSTSLVVNTVPTLLSDISTDLLVYSEVGGFNVVTLSFDSTEPLDTAPASLKVTIGSAPMSCGTYQVIAGSATANYACTYAVTTAAGAGTKAITITAVDNAGNQTTAGTSVTFDFTAPTLTPTVAPNPANAFAAPALTVASDKVLDGAPTLTITPFGSVIGTVTAGAATGGGTSWGFPLQAPGADGTFNIGVQGSDSVGHTSTASLAFTVDTVAPAIVTASVATDRSTYSEVTGFNVITLTFQTAKAATAVTVSGGASSWNACTYAAPTYTCVSAPLTTSLGSGTKTIAIATTDEVQNTSQASTSVVFDFTLPVLTPTAAPNPSNAASAPALSIASSKPLTVASVSSIVPVTGTGTVTSAAVTGGGTSWGAGLQGAGANGVFTISVSGTDSVGHTNTASTSFTIDAVTPTISGVATDAATYSEVAPYNTITLTFTTAKQATAVTVSGGAGSWNACTYSAPTYTCVSSALTTALLSGTKTIAVTASDEVGNTSSASTSVVFDFSVPTLIPTAAPNPANASSSPVLTIASSKPLPAAPITSVTLVSGSGSVAAGTVIGGGTSWSAPLIATAANGTFSIKVSGTDTVGHTGTATTSFATDSVVPTITNVATDRTTYSEMSPYSVITLTFNTAKQATVSVSGGAGSWAPCTYGAPTYTCTSAALTTDLGSGTKSISITATDEANNQSQAGASVVFDFSTPILTPTVAPNPANASSSPALTVASSKPLTAASVASITLTSGSGSLAMPTLLGSGTSWSGGLTASGDDGTFTIDVSGTDTVGHTGTASTTFTVDAIVPAITVVATDKTTYSDTASFNAITLTFNTAKKATTITVLGGAGSWNTCTYAAPMYTCVSRTLTTVLGSGTKTIAITAIDEVGNASTASTSVVFDFSTPTLTPTMAPNPANASSSPALTLASSKPLTAASVTSITRTSGTGSIAVPTLAGSGTSWSAAVTAAVDNGTFTINVSGTDTVGHTTTASTAFTVDTVLPTVTSVATDKATYSDAASFNVITLTFDTAKQATVTVSGGASSWNPCTYTAPTYTCVSIPLTTSLGSGTKTLAITATDEVGNSSSASTSVVFDFSTPTLTPTVAPSPANATASPVLTLASSKPLTTASVTSIVRTSGVGSIAVPTLTGSDTSWSAGLTVAGDDGTFTINVSGTDTVGHVSAASTSFTVDALVPTITNVATDRTTYSDATSFNVITLTFNTAKQATTVVVSGGAGFWNACTYFAPTYTCVSATLTTALGSGTKTIAITATDEVGNSSTAGTSVVLDFSTPVLTPTVAPNPANASSSPALTLASSKPLTAASVTSIVLASGSGSLIPPTLLGSGTSWSAALTTTGDDGTFTINVSGTDTVGHTSTASTSFTVDALVPTITNVATDRTTYSEAATFNVITLTFNTVKQATTVTVAGGANSWNACTYAAPKYTCVSNGLAGTEGSGTKTISITAKDEVGNTSQASASVVFDFTTPTLTPTAAPNPSDALSSPVLTVASSKPLTAASVTSIFLAAGTGTLATPTLTGSGTSWSAPLVASGDNGTFTINVSGSDTVGHTSTASTSFTIDAVVPAISSLTTDKATYSDAVSFNVITLTFNTTKQASSVTVTGGAGSWNPCTYAAPTYTCVSGTLTAALGSGTKTIAVATTDEVGNVSQASTSVVFDFSTPALTPTVAPNPANASSAPSLTVASSKPLSDATVTSIVRTSGAGSIAVPTLTGSGTSWSASLSATGDDGTFSISVSGTDTVGHTSAATISFTVDAVVPAISNVATDKTTYSDAASFDVITLTYNTAKPASTVTVAGGAGSWSACTYAAPTYTCLSSTLTAPLGSGTKTIVITATDEVGNTSTASASVVFDFTTPVLTPSVSPSPANASSAPNLFVASSKPLTTASVTSITRTSGAGAIAVPTLTGSGASWSAGLATTGDNGTFTINVTGTDTVGHTTTAITPFTVDAVVPAISNVVTDKTTYSDATSFNVITLTFNTAKQASTVTVTGGAGSWNACTYAAPTYTCLSNTLATSLGSGTKTIVISATDEVSNTSTASASIVLDFGIPTLAPTVAPNPANFSASPVLTLASSKPLTTASVTSITRASGSGSIAVPTLAGSGTSWSAGLTATGDNGTFTINVSGTDTVGHTTTTSTSFTLDDVVPTISTVAADKTTYSDAASFNVITLTFNTAKQATTVTVVGGAGSWNACTYAAPTYTCQSNTLAASLGSGTKTIVITATDEVSNTSTASVSVVFDFSTPTLTPTVAPNPASFSSSPALTVASSKPLTTASVTSITKTSGTGSIAVPTLTGSGTSWSAGLITSGDNGTFTINVSGTDTVGHTTTTSTPFTVDAVVPTISSVATDKTTYSDATSFNVITLTFNTAKQATTVTVSGGAGSWNACTYAAPTYTCVSTALTTGLGSGTKTIAITATDEVSNTSTASVSVVFDFSTPTLTPTVAPNPASFSSSPALTLASSKPLTAASVTSITKTSGTGSIAVPTLTGSGTSWSAGLLTSGDNGTFTINVSGTDTVGHTTTNSTSFTVDAVVPTISSVATDKTTYSDATSFNVITLTFNTAKQATSVTVSGGAGTWNACTYAAPTYTCVSTALTTGLGSGTKTIAIAATDEVGNTSTASTSVVFDFSTPALTPTVAPNPASFSSSPALTVASSKPLTAASVTSITKTSGAGSIAVPTLTGSGTSWSAGLTTSGDNGTFTINVSGTDTVGHTTTTSASFTVDAIVPTISSVATDKTTYSDAASFNVITLTFNTAKQATTVTVSGGAGSWNACTYAAPTYTCVSTALTAGLGSGTKTIAITATDEVSNTSTASASVVFDFAAPILTPTAAPNPSSAQSSPSLTVASSKPLTTASVTSIIRTSGTGSIAVPTLTGSGTSWAAGLSTSGTTALSPST